MSGPEAPAAAAAAPLPALDAATIQAIAEGALAAALGAAGDDAAVAARSARVSAAHPGFDVGYPTLLRLCCEATTPAKQASVRHFLPMMLMHMQRVQGSAGDAGVLHSASVEVGKAVGERFLPKMPTPPAEEHEEGRGCKRKKTSAT